MTWMCELKFRTLVSQVSEVKAAQPFCPQNRFRYSTQGHAFCTSSAVPLSHLHLLTLHRPRISRHNNKMAPPKKTEMTVKTDNFEIAPRQAYLCPDCGEEIKFPPGTFDGAFPSVAQALRFSNGSMLIKVWRQEESDTAHSATEPQRSPRAQQPPRLVRKSKYPVIESHVCAPRSRRQPAAPLQVPRPSQDPDSLRQPVASSAHGEQAGIQPARTEQHQQSERPLGGKIEFPSHPGSRGPSHDTNIHPGNEPASSPQKWHSLSLELLRDYDDSDDRSQYSVSSRAGTDGSQSGDRDRTFTDADVDVMADTCACRPGETCPIHQNFWMEEPEFMDGLRKFVQLGGIGGGNR